MSQAALAGEHVRSSDEPFEHLYREHAPTVYRYALGVLRNPADAEDIVQSTFTNAYRAMLGGERPDKAEHWLIKIAHNECRQRFRRLGRRAAEAPLDEELAGSTTPEDQAETAGQIDVVLKALGELPLNQRTALVMREVAGRSATEIAQFLGTSVSSVDMLLFRARRTLRERSASVGTLALVPLPRSLLSFGGTVAKGAAAAGGFGITGKAVAVLVTGVVAAGTGSVGTRDEESWSPTPVGRPALMEERSPAAAAPRAVDRPSVRSDRARPGAPEPSGPEGQASSVRAPHPVPEPPAEPAPVVEAPAVSLPPVVDPSPPGAAPSLPSPPPVQVPDVPPAPVVPLPEPPIVVAPEFPALPEPSPPPEVPLP